MSTGLANPVKMSTGLPNPVKISVATGSLRHGCMGDVTINYRSVYSGHCSFLFEHMVIFSYNSFIIDFKRINWSNNEGCISILSPTSVYASWSTGCTCSIC